MYTDVRRHVVFGRNEVASFAGHFHAHGCHGMMYNNTMLKLNETINDSIIFSRFEHVQCHGLAKPRTELWKLLCKRRVRATGERKKKSAVCLRG